MDLAPALLADVVARLRAAGCVFAEDEAALIAEAAETPDGLDAMVHRRVAGDPLEHILGWAEFCGLRIPVEPGVFVPRRRTELLVQEAAAILGRRRLAGAGAGAGAPDPAGPGAASTVPVVVEMCCGAAGVAAALAHHAGPLELYASDVDAASVRCAARTLAPFGGTVVEGDLYDALPTSLRGRVTVLAANAPYVPTDAIALMPPEARLHEPIVALDGGPDGLDVQRRVIAGAASWLEPGGHLLVETSVGQAPATAAAMSAAGLRTRTVRSEELDGTVVVGRRP